HIIIDALDEAEILERSRILDWIKQILGFMDIDLHILMTSRKGVEIEDVVTSIPAAVTMVLGEGLNNDDIIQYVEDFLAISSNSRLRRMDEEMNHEVRDTIIAKTNGMFRWASLQLKELTHVHSHPSIRRQLRNLPETLDSTYERILCCIKEKSQARQLLAWLSFSIRPLKLEELVEVVIIEFDLKSSSSVLPIFNPEIRVEPDSIASICSSLATVSEDHIRLSHLSVKEYLLSDKILLGPASFHGLTSSSGHAIIAQTCLSYIFHFSESFRTQVDWNMDLEAPLFRYSQEHWTFHARQAQLESPNVSETLQRAIMMFIHSSTAPFTLDIARGFAVSPLSFAAYHGLSNAIAELVHQGRDINEIDKNIGSALMAAVEGDHTRVVKQLLEYGAVVNLQRGRIDAFLTAAKLGMEEIVKLLLHKQMDIEA
ncbi:hypothetical protein M422DRAFT_116329, partial [Sphaerobolus stellatus SS14]